MIRLFSRTKGEAPSEVNHSFVVVKGGPPQEAVVIEALSTVRRHKLVDQYAAKATEVEIWRPSWLTDQQRQQIAWEAAGFINREYGYHKIAANALDRIFYGGRRAVFRSWFPGEEQPICSHLVALAYLKAVGYRFGGPPEAIQPDDIADWVRKNEYADPERWNIVMPLAPLKDWFRWHTAANREV